MKSAELFAASLGCLCLIYLARFVRVSLHKTISNTTMHGAEFLECSLGCLLVFWMGLSYLFSLHAINQVEGDERLVASWGCLVFLWVANSVRLSLLDVFSKKRTDLSDSVLFEEFSVGSLIILCGSCYLFTAFWTGFGFKQVGSFAFCSLIATYVGLLVDLGE